MGLVMDSMKKCSKCGVEKGVGEFSPQKEGVLGLASYCKTCKANCMRLRRKEKPELIRSIERKSASGKGRFGKSCKEARRHGWEWSIERKDYCWLISQPCHYHGGKITDTGIGLDRLDNMRGYHFDNVVPCCWVCNTTRGNRFSPSEMLRLGKLVAEIFIERGFIDQTPKWEQRRRNPEWLKLISGGGGKNVH